MPSPRSVEPCANCGMAIGALETPYVWKQSVVCATCHHKLVSAEQSPHQRIAPPALPQQRPLKVEDSNIRVIAAILVIVVFSMAIFFVLLVKGIL